MTGAQHAPSQTAERTAITGPGSGAKGRRTVIADQLRGGKRAYHVPLRVIMNGVAPGSVAANVAEMATDDVE